jgi:hypothetical protein
MATANGNQAFVDSLLSDIIIPGVDNLLDSRYFRDLRAGTLSQLQGFAIQHYIHNMGSSRHSLSAPPSMRPRTGHSWPTPEALAKS